MVRPLISLILLGGALGAFLGLTGAVLGGATTAFDERILLSMRTPGDLSDPIGGQQIEELSRDFTALGGTGVLTALSVSIVGYLLIIGKRRLALIVVLAVGSGILLSLGLKQGFDRPRPELVPHGSNVYTSSFPSGHSMMAAICYLTLGGLLCSIQNGRRAKVYILSMAILNTLAVGISRVHLGVHWPTDVLAGWLAGGIWALAVWLLIRWWQARPAARAEGSEIP